MILFSNTTKMDLDLLWDALRNYSAFIQEVQNQDNRKLCYIQMDKHGNPLPLAPVRIEDRVVELMAAIDSEKQIINGRD